MRQPSIEPKTALKVATQYGLLKGEDRTIAVVFLRISTVSDEDVLYALEFGQARAMAKDILHKTKESSSKSSDK